MKMKSKQLRLKLIKFLIIKLLVIVGLVISITTPTYAWGDTTHGAIVSKLDHVPSSIKDNPEFSRGGAVGTDMFFFLPGSEYYSRLAHTTRTADLPREMLKISDNRKEKAFSYGWLSHVASDAIGHRDYINPIAGSDSIIHHAVEIGVDANIEDVAPSFSIPYRVIQKAYKEIYDTTISYDTIYHAAKIEAGAIYIERDLIKSGFFDSFKDTFNDFQEPYKDSITYSKKVINNPSILSNIDLNTGMPISSSIISEEKSQKIKIKNDIRDAAIELVENDIIEVPIDTDKTNEEIMVKEPIIKNKEKYNDLKNKIMEIIKNR